MIPMRFGGTVTGVTVSVVHAMFSEIKDLQRAQSARNHLQGPITQLSPP